MSKSRLGLLVGEWNVKIVLPADPANFPQRFVGKFSDDGNTITAY